MKVQREEIRQAVIGELKTIVEANDPTFRVKWPGFAAIDVSEDKTPYANVRIVYTDGMDVGLGPDADSRYLGTIVVELCYKEGDSEGMLRVNSLLDKLARGLTSNDNMFPLRTYAARQVTPPNGASQGWEEEGLVTPFWFDTSKA